MTGDSAKPPSHARPEKQRGAIDGEQDPAAEDEMQFATWLITHPSLGVDTGAPSETQSTSQKRRPLYLLQVLFSPFWVN